MMADYGIGFLGQYITAAELVGKTPTLTIDRVELEQVESMKGDDDDGPKKAKMRDRWVIYFANVKDPKRGWLLNRTNAEAIKEMWGRDVVGWPGHKITLMTQMVKVGPKMEPGIRVKGSPELTEPLTFELKLPKKKKVNVTLLPTGKTPVPPPAPDTQPTTEETA